MKHQDPKVRPPKNNQHTRNRQVKQAYSDIKILKRYCYYITNTNTPHNTQNPQTTKVPGHTGVPSGGVTVGIVSGTTPVFEKGEDICSKTVGVAEDPRKKYDTKPICKDADDSADDTKDAVFEAQVLFNHFETLISIIHHHPNK